MSIEVGHAGSIRRIAINVGAGFVQDERRDYGSGSGGRQTGVGDDRHPDGFDGLLHPERYPDGGLVTLSPQLIENLDPAAGASWASHSGSIRFMSARSMKTRWSRNWICPMSF